MKYTIPTLMALSQVTDVVCSWTPNARDCNLLRPDLSKRPTLKENCPNIAAVSSTIAQQPGKDGRSKFKSHCRPRTTIHTPSDPSFTPMNAGFARFLQEHSSPTHQRVTAGGRIVPMVPHYQVTAGGQIIPLVTPRNHPRPPEKPGKATIPGKIPEIKITDYGEAHDAHDALAPVIANAPDAPKSAPVPAGLLPAFEPASAPSNAAAPAPAPAASSFNPEAPVFVPRRRENPYVARINAERIQRAKDRYWKNIWEQVAKVPLYWNDIWPPFARSNMQESELESYLVVRTQLAQQFVVGPVHACDLPQDYLLQGNPALGFRPNQPIPVVFNRGYPLRLEALHPGGMYWVLLRMIFRVTNEGYRQAQHDYDINLGHLVRLVKWPEGPYETFMLLHATEWLRYHCQLLDHLIASVDYRRASLPGSDPCLTAERVSYVNKRASVTGAIKQLEQALEFAHFYQEIYTFWWVVIRAALNSRMREDVGRVHEDVGRVHEDVVRVCENVDCVHEDVGRVREDAHHSPARYDKSDVPSGVDYCQQGAEDMVSSDDEASGYAEHLEFADSCDISVSGDGPAGEIGQAEDSMVICTEPGPLINSGSSQFLLTDSQPVREPGEDGLEAGGGGESSSQLVLVDKKGKQLVVPGYLRELIVDREEFFAKQKTEGSEAVSNCLNKLVVTPTKTTAAVSRSHAHADKGKLSDVETTLARMRV